MTSLRKSSFARTRLGVLPALGAVFLLGAGCKSGGGGGADGGNNGNLWTAKDLGAGRLVALNASGQLLGVDQSQQTFLIAADGTHTSLPALEAGSSTVGTAIDASGNAVGYSEGINGLRAVRARSGSWTAISGVGTSWSAAIGVSDQGAVVGVAGTGAIGELRAFSLTGAGAAATLPLPADKDSVANVISAAGAIAGIVETAAGATHAFVISNGLFKDLGTLGGTNSAAYGINRRGEVVGVSELADGSRHAFYAAPGGALVDLGVPTGSVNSDARGVDDQGRVAGNAYDAAGISHPVVFIPGGATVAVMPVDAAGAAFVGASIAAMSPDGHMVGWGTPRAGSVHSILWTP